MIIKQPTRFFLVAGSSEGFSELNAFDQALLEAGVGDTNLVRMSSILPPNCQQIDRVPLPYGALVPVAYSSFASSTPGETVGAAVAIGIPEDPALPGLIMEYHATATAAEVKAQVREMVVHGMAYRQRPIREVLVIGAEHVVQTHGAAFAGVVLWDESRR